VATGTATIDFGGGSQVGQVAVTGQSAILSTSNVEAYLMASDSTADNADYNHRIVPMRLRCGNLVAGTGFTIYAVCDWTCSQTFLLRWVWL
jgi:hypothetical protein